MSANNDQTSSVVASTMNADNTMFNGQLRRREHVNVTSIEELIEALAVRIMWLDQRRDLSDETLDKFKSRLPDSILSMLSVFDDQDYCISMDGFMRIFRDADDSTKGLNELTLGVRTYALIDKLKNQQLNVQRYGVIGMHERARSANLNNVSGGINAVDRASSSNTFGANNVLGVNNMIGAQFTEPERVDLGSNNNIRAISNTFGRPASTLNQFYGLQIPESRSHNSSRSSSISELSNYRNDSTRAAKLLNVNDGCIRASPAAAMFDLRRTSNNNNIENNSFANAGAFVRPPLRSLIHTNFQTTTPRPPAWLGNGTTTSASDNHANSSGIQRIITPIILQQQTVQCPVKLKPNNINNIGNQPQGAQTNDNNVIFNHPVNKQLDQHNLQLENCCNQPQRTQAKYNRANSEINTHLMGTPVQILTSIKNVESKPYKREQIRDALNQSDIHLVSQPNFAFVDQHQNLVDRKSLTSQAQFSPIQDEISKIDLDQAYAQQMVEIARMKYEWTSKQAELRRRYVTAVNSIGAIPIEDEEECVINNPPISVLRKPDTKSKQGKYQEQLSATKTKPIKKSRFNNNVHTCSTTDFSDDDFYSLSDAEDVSLTEGAYVPRSSNNQQIIFSQNPTFKQMHSKRDDIVDWFKSFEKVAQAQCWNSAMMAAQAPINFKDEAEDIWDRLSTEGKLDYNIMKAHMIKRMKPPGSDGMNLNDYYSLTQGVGETPAQLASRLKKLVERSSRLRASESDSSMARQYIRALNVEISASLVNTPFKKVDEALKAAERVDA